MATPSFLTDSWEDVQKFFGLNGQTTATIPASAAGTPKADVLESSARLSNLGTLTSIFGGINSAIGSYYAAKTAQYQEQSQASSLQFQSSMDAINAREAELSAQSILEAGKTQVQQYTMRAAQQDAQTQVGTAARGVDLSSGSAQTERATEDLTKQMDVLSIGANAVRAASAQRTQATNYSNESLLSNVSASNLRASADTISPGLAASTSLLTSATSVASQWDWRRRLQLASSGGA